MNLSPALGMFNADLTPFSTPDITSLYVAEFGAGPVGKRLFVRASLVVDGFESLGREFHARVPAA